MTHQLLVTDESGTFLVKGNPADVEEGTLTFRVGLPGGDTHMIVMPPNGVTYRVDGGVLTFESRADGGTVVRQYGSWVYVECVPFKPRSSGGGAQIW